MNFIQKDQNDLHNGSHIHKITENHPFLTENNNWKSVIDLADEITIKDYYWGVYNPDSAKKIKEYAHSRGKAVWIHNYISQGDDIRSEFINAVAEDPNVSGILLYEAFHSGKEGIEPNQGLIKMEADKISYYEPAIKALRSISKLTMFP